VHTISPIEVKMSHDNLDFIVSSSARDILQSCIPILDGASKPEGHGIVS